MSFKIVRNDITKVTADAIVNTANPEPTYAAGTDAAIYQAAGAKQLLAERRKIGAIERGQAAATPAFALHAKYIIHTVGPAWADGNSGEFEALASCYKNSLALAKKLNCGSIAFPLIATGVYGFPKDRALQIAVTEVSRFLLENEMDVTLVVFDKKAFELSGRLFADMDAFIDENYVDSRQQEEYGKDFRRRRFAREEMKLREERMRHEQLRLEREQNNITDSDKNTFESKKFTLDDALQGAGETFQQRVLQLIDDRGRTDVDVYKKANLDRKLFSKIRSNENYRPKKGTALALAIALELDFPDAEDLLGRAGYAFSNSNKTDLIVRYFIEHGNYDINQINLALFEYDEKPL